jgi:hypothetical protein
LARQDLPACQSRLPCAIGWAAFIGNLVDFKYAWWSIIEAMDGYFLGAFLLPSAPLRKRVGANIPQIKPL